VGQPEPAKLFANRRMDRHQYHYRFYSASFSRRIVQLGSRFEAGAIRAPRAKNPAHLRGIFVERARFVREMPRFLREMRAVFSSIRDLEKLPRFGLVEIENRALNGGRRVRNSECGVRFKVQIIWCARLTKNAPPCPPYEGGESCATDDLTQRRKGKRGNRSRIMSGCLCKLWMTGNSLRLCVFA
jgi:hypothetical protein